MRTLTVSRLHREWGSYYRRSYAQVPYIRLAGQWLSDAGIQPGQQIHVEAIGNGLHITPAPVPVRLGLAKEGGAQ
jgi:hypothetical protein